MSQYEYFLFMIAWFLIYWVGLNYSAFYSLALSSATACIIVLIIKWVCL